MVLIKSCKQLVEEANAKIQTLSLDEAKEKLGQPDVQFVDIRDVRELEREGTIPGAIHAPRGMLEFWIDPDSPYFKPVFAEDKQFIFYCQSGWRSALATATLQDMGLKNACHIDGGYGNWKKFGGSTETREKKS
ncbi:rhodanese-like domain-containing protein [Haliea sp. AH-315-K21]|uniref:Rhodanese n=1 Tax=SAR86 cluster bacterium TaxID=2030880 RepID=A0A2A5CHT9_9GAMM|nr:rhodanese-like domain-containing protein [Haliea sp. AH-315-K21]MBN4075905.1 rhodanese-like domain-containing protein [Gammaproteobacteria bacterium AH-315-E17]PCJ43447.1 MAG: rhodanese [SAR86 cluster bacterium]